MGGFGKFRLVVVIACAAWLAPLAGAAPFINLNFEQATVPPGTQFVTSAALAFPGWTPQINNVPLATVYYNDAGIGEPAVALYDEPAEGLGIPLLQGNFYAVVVGSIGGGFRGSLSQVGDVPAESRSIRLLAESFRGPPRVYFNDVSIPMVRLAGDELIGYPAEFGGDITAFAGTAMVELRLENTVPPHGYIAGFDAVAFSPIAIPEPNLVLVISIAAFGFSSMRFRRIQK